jgi:hypothetical protein
VSALYSEACAWSQRKAALISRTAGYIAQMSGVHYACGCVLFTLHPFNDMG